MPTVATRLEGQLSPGEFVFLRYAFAFAALALLWPWLPGRMPRGRDFWRTLLMGVVVFNIGHLFQIAGIQLSKASDASVLLALDPLVSSLGAAIFLHERIPARRWVAFAAAITGVAVMSFARPNASVPGLLANLMIVLSFMTEAVWSVLGKPMISRWGIPKVTALALGGGTLANLAFLSPNPAGHWNAISRLPLDSWVALAFLGMVLTAFGYSAWYLVIREVSVSAASMTIYLQPILGTLLAVSLTNDRLHAGHWLGSIGILAGLILGVWDRPATRPVAVPEK